MLSEEQVTQFQKLYKDHFGEDMSRSEAMEKGIQLVRLIQLIYKPMTRDDLKRVLQRRKEIGVDK